MDAYDSSDAEDTKAMHSDAESLDGHLPNALPTTRTTTKSTRNQFRQAKKRREYVEKQMDGLAIDESGPAPAPKPKTQSKRAWKKQQHKLKKTRMAARADALEKVKVDEKTREKYAAMQPEDEAKIRKMELSEEAEGMSLGDVELVCGVTARNACK